MNQVRDMIRVIFDQVKRVLDTGLEMIDDEIERCKKDDTLEV